MKIGYLGAGAWGFCLASLLAENGHEVILWTIDETCANHMSKKRTHPRLKDYRVHDNITVTTDLEHALDGVDMVVESVTAVGIRPVFEAVKARGGVGCPIILTSKGIEQQSGLLLHEVIIEILGPDYKPQIGCISGPSIANEVIQKLPTSVVSSGYDPKVIEMITQAFTCDYFRVYPNMDISGVSFGGAMKNIMAIACGIGDGLGFGDNTKAAIMTRGLHEIRKLGKVKNCKPETLNGLSGMGDLCVTCLSKHSRNYTFGKLIAKGLDPEDAKEQIGMVVEGLYTCVSALELGRDAGIPLPITEAVHAIVYENVSAKEAVRALLQRQVKEEHL